MNVNAAAFQPRGGVGTTQCEEEGALLQNVQHVVQSLKWMFPSFSTRALTELYEIQCGKSLPKAIEAICAIEAEVEGATLQQASKAPRPPVSKPTTVMDPCDFPALGSAASVETYPVNSFSVDFASKVKTSMPGHHTMGTRDIHGQQVTQPTRHIWESEPQSYKKFETGATVASQYQDHRGDARSYAIARNTLFEQATRAFLSGDKKLAKELGEKGRHYNMLMKESHSNAARAIYSSRNAESLSGSTSGRPIIDLHGLHVKEAQSLLGNTLDELKSMGKISQVDVVVGEGKHSKGSQQHSRLRHGVVQYLTMSGYQYKEPYVGMLTVFL